MNLDELTLGQVKEIQNLGACKSSEGHPYNIGANYLIRTVTMIYTGRLVSVFPKELVIEKACWIPETERWNKSVRDCVFKEQEPYPEDKKVIIGRGSLLDCVEIDKLPTEVK